MTPHDPTRRAWLGWLAAAAVAGVAGARAANPEAASPPPRRSLRRSDRIPDVPVLDQRGEPRWFYTDLIADRMVVLNFFYVNCGGSCPGTYAVMSRLREELSPTLRDRLAFVSITLDAERDRPAELARYAVERGLNADPALAPWTLVTGTAADTEALRLAFGLRDLDPVLDADRTNHAALVVIGNDALDRWSTMPAGIRHEPLARLARRVLTPRGVEV